MSYLVVPNEVFANDATIWVAAINENLNPAATVLEYESNQVVLNSGWSTFTTADGNFTIHYQRVGLHNLTQQTRYFLTLRVAGAWKADASFDTIPWRLPGPADPPFIVMLGSCFFAREDPNGNVGRTYMNLPASARPHIKFLCGDQVYLDNPPQDFLNPFRSRNQTRPIAPSTGTFSTKKPRRPTVNATPSNRFRPASMQCDRKPPRLFGRKTID